MCNLSCIRYLHANGSIYTFHSATCPNRNVLVHKQPSIKPPLLIKTAANEREKGVTFKKRLEANASSSFKELRPLEKNDRSFKRVKANGSERTA